LVAFVGDFATVGVIIFAVTAWMERWVRRTNPTSWPNLHFWSWILLAGLIVGGVTLEFYASVNEYSKEEKGHFPDEMHGKDWHWSGRGFPFTYERIDPVESPEPRPFAMLRPPRSFEPALLVIDFLLLAIVIAELTYRFEKRQRGQERSVIIEQQ